MAKSRKGRHKKRHIGRKERLKHQLDGLKSEKEHYLQQVTVLTKKNDSLKTSLKRALLQKKTHSSLLVSSYMKFDANSAVKSSINGMPQTSKEALSSSIRKFAKENVIIKNQCLLGQGVFAKCYFATVGPNKACLKILRASTCSSFYREANILSGLCHPNVSFLLGVCESVRHKMLIFTFHGIGSNSISLHSALVSKKELDLVISVVQWKEIVIGIIAGILYIHNSSILHNDIKEDNILIDYDYNKQLKSVLVDFGKAFRDNFGRKYSLSKEEKQYYKIHHPHIAPDVRDGLRVQDKLSDVYSFGRVVSYEQGRCHNCSCLIFNSQ